MIASTFFFLLAIIGIAGADTLIPDDFTNGSLATNPAPGIGAGFANDTTGPVN